MHKFTVMLFIGLLTVTCVAVFAQHQTMPMPPCNDFIPTHILVTPYLPKSGPELTAVPKDIENIKLNSAQDIEFFIQSANYFLDKQNYENARNIAFKVLNKDTNNTEALFIIANSYAGEKNFSKAMDYYQKLKKINTRFSGLHRMIGYIYTQIDKKNSEKAKKEYELEMRYNPTNWRTYINRAVLYVYDDEKEKAFLYYAKAVELGQDNIEPLLIAARFCEQLQVHQKEGKVFLEKVLQLYPDSWRACEIKAGFHYHDKEYKKAEEAYLHSLKLYERTTTLYELCWTYVKMGEITLAKQIYERAHLMNPTEDSCYKTKAKEFLQEKGIIVF